jgi:shikimate dehydrogenase
MRRDPGTGIYGLVGRGISYSLSPLIFRTVFAELGWPAVYALFDLTRAQLPRFVSAAGSATISGFNVTQPYKVAMMPFLDDIDPAARVIGAVNTVVRSGGRWSGYNTDVLGVRSVLSPYIKTLRDGSAVIIGCGGAARAVAWTLAQKLGMAQVTFAVRSPSKAYSVVRRMKQSTPHRCQWTVCSLSREAVGKAASGAKLLVNATPVGGTGSEQLSPLPRGVKIPSSLIVFDLIYRPTETRLIREARVRGCRGTINGWRMLVTQAEESFALWTGSRFPARIRTTLLKMENEH